MSGIHGEEIKTTHTNKMKSEWLEPNLISGTNLDARTKVKYPNQYELALKEAWTLQNQTTKKERCSNIKLPCFFFNRRKQFKRLDSNQKDSEF